MATDKKIFEFFLVLSVYISHRSILFECMSEGVCTALTIAVATSCGIDSTGNQFMYHFIIVFFSFIIVSEEFSIEFLYW